MLVAAVADNGVIGDGPDIPWHIPGEQAQFKALTMGHTLLMGRTTFESIGRPLPGRTTIVLTRDVTWSHEGVLVAHTIEDALALAATLPGDVMVAGGAQVYAAALPYAAEQVLTRVHLAPGGDVHYPAFDTGEWVVTRREPGETYDREWLVRARVSDSADPAVIWPVYDAVFADRDRSAWEEAWRTHSARDGFRIATVECDGELAGFAYGYTGERGQWWSDAILAALLPAVGEAWVGGHFELVELAVLGAHRSRGLGRALLRAISSVPHERLLLQTDADAADPAHRLYASEGWRVLGPGVGAGTVVMGKRPG